ncbi:hypothetical protein IAD21_06036 [Abditibacteriota bacterium]|nr:hypothetical protein IAD21_06036 [Abditibacteriota bacterium]
MTALRFNPVIQALGTRLEKQGKCKMLIIGAAMRKLLCLAYGVLKSGCPFNPLFATKPLDDQHSICLHALAYSTHIRAHFQQMSGKRDENTLKCSVGSRLLSSTRLLCKSISRAGNLNPRQRFTEREDRLLSIVEEW